MMMMMMMMMMMICQQAVDKYTGTSDLLAGIYRGYRVGCG